VLQFLIAAVPVIGKLLDKIIPDPVAAADAKQRLFESMQKGELAYLDADVKLALAQIDVNKEEARDPSLFKSGWRPAVGWLCVAGFGYMAILRPILPWVLTVAGVDVPPLPAIDTAEIGALLFGLLGLGGMRTAERLKGKA
jgi:hypothetical protein